MGFKIVNHFREINSCNGWVKSIPFSNKGKVVDEKGNIVDGSYSGRKYRLVTFERTLTCLERAGRGFLGVLAIVCSLGLALFSGALRELFIKQKKCIYFGIIVHCSVPKSDDQKEATIIQKLIRGRNVRKSLLKSPHKKTAIICRKLFRARNARKFPPVPKTPSEKAAITFQKLFRGRKARKPLIDRNLYPKYLVQCKKTEERETKMARAKGGRAPVYLPKETPEIVIKRIGKEFSVKRFHKMQEVRAILDSQKSSHLIIPKARLCRNALVEDRLPINVDKYHNMGVYVDHSQLFDDPVREMVRLFSKGILGDLFTSGISFVPDVLSEVRYDNLPFYIVEQNKKKEARIGLIDLEHFGLNHQSSASENLRVLARIFPYHLELIKKEAQQLNMQIDAKLNKELDVCAKIGEKFLEIEYINHRDFLRKKEVSKTVPESFPVSPQRIEEVTLVIQKELLKLNEGINGTYTRKKYTIQPPKSFLLENPEEVAKELAGVIAKLILDNLKTEIDSHQKEHFSELSEKENAEHQIVRFRSPILYGESICGEVHQLVSKSPKLKVKIEWGDERTSITEQLFYVALKELERGGEIFNFEFGSNCFDVCCIRY